MFQFSCIFAFYQLFIGQTGRQKQRKFPHCIKQTH